MTTARKLKDAIRIQQIMQCKKDHAETGITVTRWCQEHKLSEKSYWYYHKKLGDELSSYAVQQNLGNTIVPSGSLDIQMTCEQPLFLPLNEPAHPNSTVTLKCNQLTLELSEDISDEFLIRIMKAVSHV